MKWFAQWWGMALVADTEEDEKFLRELKDRLPEDAERSYEIGKVKEVDADGKYTLEISR